LGPAIYPSSDMDMKSTDADTFISCGLFPNWGGGNSLCGWAIDAKARSGKRRARADGLDVPKDARATLTPTSRIRILGTALSHRGPNHARADWFGPAPCPANPIPSHNGTRQLGYRRVVYARDRPAIASLTYRAGLDASQRAQATPAPVLCSCGDICSSVIS